MNLSHLPDSHPVYVPGYGEVTAGALRVRTESEGLADTEAATVRMWVAIVRHSPKAKPWRDGHFDAGGKRYPLSVFTSDALVRLSTSSGMTQASGSNVRSRRSSARRSLTSGSR